MIDHALAELAIVFVGFAIALITTLAFELPVAMAFRVRGRGLAAVALVNVITNPVFNLAMLIVVLIVGYGMSDAADTSALIVAAAVVLEIVVVVVEWRLLVWALNGTAGSSRRLLALSVTMNLVSAVLARGLYAGVAWLLSRGA